MGGAGRDPIRIAAADEVALGGYGAVESPAGIQAPPPPPLDRALDADDPPTDFDGHLDVAELLARGYAGPARRDSIRRRLLALADALALTLAYLAVVAATPGTVPLKQELVLIGALPLWVVLNKLLGLYDHDAPRIHKSTLNELPRIAHSLALGAGMVYLLVPPLLSVEIDRTQTVLFLCAATVLVPGLRLLVRRGVARHYPPERILIVGSGTVADIVARKIRLHPEYGATLVGFVAPELSGLESDDGNFPLLGHPRRFEELCRDLNVDRVVIAFSSLSHEQLLNAVRASKLLGVKISVVPRLYEVMGRSMEIDEVEGMTLLGLRGLNRTRSSLFLKRAIDVGAASAGVLLLGPLLLTIALAVKLTSRGPVFFRQRRIGRDNESFDMFKFRTMCHNAEELKESVAHLNEARAPMFKITDDPRVTRVGRFLRRTSLDELPQLFNVIRGEMSLVGPRPLVPSEDDAVIGWHRARLELTPGLTGPWQVMGRNAIPFQEMVKLDYLYVTDWSLWNDLKLLVRTAPAILARNGR